MTASPAALRSEGNPADLPLVDELTREIIATPEAVWPAVWRALRVRRPGWLLQAFAWLWRAEPRWVRDEPTPRPGAALVGFGVVDAVAPERLVLDGRHRFARYRMALLIESTAPDRCRVRLQTYAVFPGRAGAVYRRVVIGSGGHVVIVGRLLERIRRLAERQAHVFQNSLSSERTPKPHEGDRR